MGFLAFLESGKVKADVASTMDGNGDLVVGNDLTVSNDLVVTGNLTVNGSTVTTNTETLSVEDPLIELASGNTGGDTVDMGLYGTYNDGSQRFWGIFRDATDGVLKLFDTTTVDPATGTTIDTGGAGYDHGDLQVGALTADDASSLASGTTVGNLTLANGSITDSSGAIDFGNENLSTTGTLSSDNVKSSGYMDFDAIAAPGAPADGDGRIYVAVDGSDEELFFHSDAGLVQITKDGALNAGEISVPSTNALVFTVNNDSAQGTEEDAGIVLKSGDAVGETNSVFSASMYNVAGDTGAPVIEFGMDDDGTAISASMQIGLTADSAVDLDAFLYFHGTDNAGADSSTSIVWLGHEAEMVVGSGASVITASANLDADAGLDVSGGDLTLSGGAATLTANAASSLTTSAGALTLTSAAAATWSTVAGALSLDGAGGVNLVGNAGEVDITTTGAFDVNVGAHTLDADSIALTSGGAFSMAVVDDSGQAFKVAESTNNYFLVDTSNTGAAVVLGNAATNPDFNLLGSGALTVGATGAVDAPVCVRFSTPATHAAIAVGDALYIDSSGTVNLCDADAEASSKFVGFALDSSAENTADDIRVAVAGKVSGPSGGGAFTAGGEVFLSLTAGELTQTAPSDAGDVVLKVGYAIGADAVFIQPGEAVVLA